MKNAIPLCVVVLAGCADHGAAIPEPNQPFGLHSVGYAGGAIQPAVSPNEMDAATAAFYDAWKQRYLVAGCGAERYYVSVGGADPHLGRAADSITTSEANGYGMIVAALMAGHDPDARRAFDGLYRFFR